LRLDGRVEPADLPAAAEDLVPRGGIGTREMERPPAAGEHERQQPFGEVPDVRRRPDAVVDPGDGIAGAEPRDLSAQIVVAAPVHEPGPHDHVLPNGGPDELLPEQLRAAVGADRSRRVGFVVRRALLAVEHVVGRDVEEDRPGGAGGERERLRPERVVAERPVGVGLVRVDLRERSEVQHHVGLDLRDRRHRRVVIADVELVSRERAHVVM
jgi:hypothetical protein